jgi:hypothetical protein
MGKWKDSVVELEAKVDGLRIDRDAALAEARHQEACARQATCELNVADQEIEALRAEIAKPVYLMCAYCLTEFGQDNEAVRAHIESCEQHPLFREKQAVRDAQAEVRVWVRNAAVQAQRAAAFERLWMAAERRIFAFPRPCTRWHWPVW